MLIVNADDWGLRPEVTDAILESWSAGAITAASAMVGMDDSRRAARLGATHRIPLGLHLNLTTPFTAADAAADRRLRQQRATTYFAGPRRRRFLFDIRNRALLDACVTDQLDAFAELYGALPQRGDGHQHIQVCPTVLSTSSLGRLATLRGAHSFSAGQRSLANRAHRGAVNWALRRRFRSARFLSLRDLHPKLGGDGLDALATLAQREDIEVMVHPAWQDEREILLSSEWLHLLQQLPTGSHVDLR
ncbi:MAG TPA: ChbG/HpnK family deacetylase [Solirubrobacterales bacterium]|nr:ChbG/HpnK family deacetylase [Solirubrobacterales bacterium]